MEISLSTFLLEILNFLVLIWILKRFLYRPVLDAVAHRRAEIQKTLDDAKAIRSEADDLKSRYEGRLDQWEHERSRARGALREELAAERGRLLAALETELDGEREKAQVLEARREADCLARYQEMCLDQGVRFASRLLADLAGPEVHARLCDMALRQLTGLPTDKLASIRLACEESPEEARVLSAYPMTADQRRALQQALGELMGMTVTCHYDEDAALIAGLRVTVGPWVFRASLQDELKGFAESGHDAD